MGQYDTQQVCLEGHQITDRYNSHPEYRQDFCDDCGAQTIHKCPKCNAEIRGDLIVTGVAIIGGKTPVPQHCHKCGTPYPWAEKMKNDTKIATLTLLDPIKIVEHICNRFHIVAKQLRTRHQGRPTLDINDEYDVQDVLHAILRMNFDDIRTEEWTPSYAGRSARMDFLLKKEQVVIEVKKSRQGLGAKELGEQLLVDIERYKNHPSCKTLICFVYDPEERIINPRGIENDLSKNENGLTVKVFICTK